MTAVYTVPVLKWSLSGSGQSTTITGSGNSGPWGETPPADYPSSAINLGDVSDVTLYVWATAVSGTTPSLVVSLDVFDDEGNLIPAVMSVAAVTAAATPKWASCGLHGGSASSYIVLPQYARVSWAFGGTTPSASGAEIALYGR